jgi:hypothetical protein
VIAVGADSCTNMLAIGDVAGKTALGSGPKRRYQKRI